MQVALSYYVTVCILTTCENSMRFGISSISVIIVAVIYTTLGPVAQNALSQEKSEPARCIAANGVVLTPSLKGSWGSLVVNAEIPADVLLIALFGAEFTLPSGNVSVRAIADVGERGPVPVLEAALRFHAPKSADLEVSLERGILILTNTKKSGSARVRLRFRAEIIEITLDEPKARLAIQVYGRHVPGPVKLDDPKEDDPVAYIVFLALEGHAVITTEKHAARLHVAPGPGLYWWDSVTRAGEVVRFEKTPDFAKPMTEVERKSFETICGFAKAWAGEPGDIAMTLQNAAGKPNATERKAGVVALGALGELSRLMQVFNNKEHADTRDMAILVLRHWLGREPGQVSRLYGHLTKVEKYSSAQARTLLHLLNGIEAEKRHEPETYDLLIQELKHSKLPIRELAHWHLVRLAPEGKSIAFDAAGDESQRLMAVEAWRRLIPEGQLPPAPKKKALAK